MRLLDRYVLRNFLQAYLYCAAAFFSIWLVFDISDKISTFLDEKVALSTVAAYYFTQFPEIIVIVLPIALLLALLFCLSKMSRTNEIVSMLANGVSVPRLLLPLFVMGLLTAAVSGALNYSLAPHAEQARKAYFEDMRADARDPSLLGQIFRNRSDNRTWFIQRFRPDRNEFTTVQVLQQDANDNIVINYLAASGSYLEQAHEWELKQVKVVKYDEAGNITEEQNFDTLRMPQWSE
ncbi:MAG: LptF/LptG family permease, partial [Verrucomicrobiota bacterium]|nr:LptF/LptG family permease [Verrucomicrobiota bacterium]